MNRLDHYRAVLLGVVIGMSFLITTFNVFTSNDNPTEATTPKSNFEVVDTYKGCDLLRWGNNQLAEYKYVLHCPQK